LAKLSSGNDLFWIFLGAALVIFSIFIFQAYRIFSSRNVDELDVRPFAGWFGKVRPVTLLFVGGGLMVLGFSFLVDVILF